MKVIQSIVSLAILTLAWTSCSRSDVPLTRVGNKTITSKDLDRAWAELPSGYQNRDKKWLLETLINREILTQEARARGLDRSEAVRSQLANATTKKLTDELFQREVIGRVEVSEEEMRRYFETSGMDSIDEVHVSHIVVKTMEEAERIVQELHAGGNFAQLARQYSLDQRTAAQGGNLGYWREGTVVGPVAEKAFSMAVGSVSEPVRDERGYYHLITVLDKRPVGREQQQARVKNRIEAEKIEKKRWEYMSRLTEEYGLKVNDETLSFLLQQGRISIAKIPVLSPSEADRILLTYRGGSIRLGMYVAWLNDVETVRRRPNPVDSAQVVRFAQIRAVTEVLFPEVARRQGLDREEAVRSYLERKKADLMIEELKRVTVEATILPEDTVRAYYERHLDLYTQPERVFVEVALAENQQEAQAILEACQQGGDMAQVARKHPLRSGERPSYRVFSFTPDKPDKEEASLILSELIKAAQDIPVGGWKGPVALGSATGETPFSLYAVLHILERRASYRRSLNEPVVREEILTALRKAKYKKIEQAFERFLTEIQKEYGNRIKRYANNL